MSIKFFACFAFFLTLLLFLMYRFEKKAAKYTNDNFASSLKQLDEEVKEIEEKISKS